VIRQNRAQTEFKLSAVIARSVSDEAIHAFACRSVDCFACARMTALPMGLSSEVAPVRVKKTRQNKKLESGSDSIRTEHA
jgi:hypothetical protein